MSDEETKVETPEEDVDAQQAGDVDESAEVEATDAEKLPEDDGDGTDSDSE